MRGVFNGIALMLLGIATEIFGPSAQIPYVGEVGVVLVIVGFLVVLYYSAYGLDNNSSTSDSKSEDVDSKSST